MASNTNPVFNRTAVIGQAVITAANTSLDGTGTLTTIVTASNAEGVRVDSLNVRPIGTNSTASVLRIFIHNGTSAFLLKEVALPIYTLSQTVTSDASSTTVYFNGVDNPQLVLPQNYSIRCTVGTAGTAGWAVTAMGGSLTA